MSRHASAQETIDEALVHFAAVEEYARLDTTQQVVVDGMAMRLAAGIDVLGGLPQDVRAEVVGDEWPLLRGMRNRLVHGYITTDPQIILRTAASELPALVAGLRGWRSSHDDA